MRLSVLPILSLLLTTVAAVGNETWQCVPVAQCRKGETCYTGDLWLGICRNSDDNCLLTTCSSTPLAVILFLFFFLAALCCLSIGIRACCCRERPADIEAQPLLTLHQIHRMSG